jgi:hypothetical protein
MKNLRLNKLVDRITCIDCDGKKVQVKFDSKNNMFWKVDTQSSVLFGREKVNFKQLNNSMYSISWKEDTGVSVNMVFNFITNKLIAIWTSDNDLNAVEGHFNVI